MLSSAQNSDGPSDTSSGRPKQLTMYFNKIAKIKTATELAKTHIFTLRFDEHKQLEIMFYLHP